MTTPSNRSASSSRRSSQAIQNGLAQRDTRRAQRGAADLKPPVQAPVAAPVAVDPDAIPGEIDLSKVELPADVAAAVEGEIDGGASKRKPVRARKAPVKAE